MRVVGIHVGVCGKTFTLKQKGLYSVSASFPFIRDMENVENIPTPWAVIRVSISRFLGAISLPLFLVSWPNGGVPSGVQAPRHLVTLGLLEY